MRAGILAGMVAALTVCATADAQTTTPGSFSCAASAVSEQFAGGSVLNPITVGAGGQPCQAGTAGAPNATQSLTFPESAATAKTAYAIVDPGGAVPATSTPSASAGVEGLNIGAGAITVDAARSSITAACVNGLAQYTPTSTAANIALAGQPIVSDGQIQPITDALTQALGALVEVKLNEVVDVPGGGKVVRAAHITLLRGTTPLADVIVAQSGLGANGDPCTATTPVTPTPTASPTATPTATATATATATSTPNNNNGNNGGNNNNGNANGTCPDGATYDASRNVCVVQNVVVGPPGKGPVGGHVITLSQARKRYPKSPCVRGGGLKYVVVGTEGPDRITGTNRGDRILGLRGNDHIDAGKGRDCIDAGQGRDGLTGGQQSDRVYGRKGRDFIYGDSRSDKLYGGRGPDYINSGYGADLVKAGKGNDKVNIATAGKRAVAYGGKGTDKVRLNPGDLPAFGFEKIISTHRIK